MSPNELKIYLSNGWRQQSGEASLSDVNASIPVKKGWATWRKFVAFIGPGYLVAVGYMDPGNWATSLAGGAQFGYTLLAVALISNLMAILLQSLCARLGIASGRDLAQACRDSFPKPVSFILWVLAELAICATDLAEVIGTAIGLLLLFHIPLEIGVLITALDVFIVLAFQRLGFRWIEAFIMTLLLIIFSCFGIQMWLAQPDIAAIFGGFIPSTQIVTNPAMLYIALGIIGATVMPHNLYLHSSIVQTRAVGKKDEDKKEAIKLATWDSTLALMLALLVNASILILAASTFHSSGNSGVTELQDAHNLLTPLLGSTLAGPLFAIALLCCGLSSTVTATLAGQIVMEGFINIKISPWLRRLITRLIAIIPAITVTLMYGDSGTAKLLIASQVVLSLQLPFAVVPLVMFTMDKRKLGDFTAPLWVSGLAILIAIILITLNMKMLWDVASDTFLG